MSDLIDTSSLCLAWTQAPWDEAVCGFPVLQIDQIAVRGPQARADMRAFEEARDRAVAGLVSCRLPHDHLVESMLLEECGFRFIEMLYTPQLELAKTTGSEDTDSLVIERATPLQMPALLAIAGNAFRNERFRMDPRLDSSIADRRYQNWVASTPGHPHHQLYTVSDEDRVVAFFVIELLGDGTCYWHLNALAEVARGQGYGRRVWSAMIGHARDMGAVRVRTSVVARNVRVLSLYVKLGFTLPPPAMTFHWMRA